MFEFIKLHYQWIFSGVGVFILSLFLTNKFSNKSKLKQNIKNNSSGIQAGRDININTKDKNE